MRSASELKAKWIFIALAVVSSQAIANGVITPEQLEKIRIGFTTSQQVTEILGAPKNVQKFSRRGVEAWDYRVQGGRTLDPNVSIEIDSKGVVSNIQRIVYYGP